MIREALSVLWTFWPVWLIPGLALGVWLILERDVKKW